MQTLIDFLTFKTFITPSLLIIMYYMGVILVPLFSWLLARWLINKFHFIATAHTQLKQSILEAYRMLSTKQKIIFIGLLISIIIMMEIIWRMMFETLLAYFQMRDYLQIISTH